MKPIVAVFDFDGTLYNGESGVLFTRYLLGKKKFFTFFIKYFPMLFCYKFRIQDELMLRSITRGIFANRTTEEVEAVANYFALTIIPRNILSRQMDILRDHQKLNHRCIIVSRAYDCYLYPWAKSMGINEVIPTRLAKATDQRYTGELAEPSCNGPKKVEYLSMLLGDRNRYEIYAYGDSKGDDELISWADHGYWVKG